jgi:transcriptional regulator with XRE-family HTH domain
MAFRGDRLKGIREAKKLKPAALARLTGLNQSGLQRLEDGSAKHPRYATVAKLAEKLDVLPEYLDGAGKDIPYEDAIVLQALERFKRLELAQFGPIDQDALNRAAQDDDAPNTVAGWQAFVSMSMRAWGKPPKVNTKLDTDHSFAKSRRPTKLKQPAVAETKTKYRR